MPQFGDTTFSALSAVPGSTDRCWATKYTCPEIGTATDVYVYLAQSVAATVHIKGLIFAVSGGEPGALLAQSASITIPSGSGNGWKQCPLITPLSLTATDYYIGVVFDSFEWDANSEVASGMVSRRKESYTFSSPPATFGTPDGTDADTQYQFYVEYINVTFEQEGYRWRNDDGSEAAATWKAAQDATINLAPGQKARLRVLINATSDPAGKTFQLEFRKVGAGHTWTKVMP